MIPTMVKNGWRSCKNAIDRSFYAADAQPKEMLTSRWNLQSKMQPNVSQKRSAFVPRIPSLMKHPTQNRSGSLSLGPLTGENCSPCYYGQSVRRDVRSAATIIAASRPPEGFWGQEKVNLTSLVFVFRGAESFLAQKVQ